MQLLPGCIHRGKVVMRLPNWYWKWEWLSYWQTYRSPAAMTKTSVDTCIQELSNYVCIVYLSCVTDDCHWTRRDHVVLMICSSICRTYHPTRVTSMATKSCSAYLLHGYIAKFDQRYQCVVVSWYIPYIHRCTVCVLLEFGYIQFYPHPG